MKYTKTIRASKNVRPARRPVRASQVAMRKAVKADDEIEDVDIDVEDFDDGADVEVDIDAPGEVTVDEAATELLFEAEDVAELVAEVTGEAVDVTVDDGMVTFAIGEDEYTVTPEGDEEIVEESKRIRRSAKAVKAGRKIPARRPAMRRPASAKVAASRKIPTRKVAASRKVATRRTTK